MGVGFLGLPNSVLVIPSNREVHLPTDILGITQFVYSYPPKEIDDIEVAKATMGSVSNDIFPFLKSKVMD
ncbi:hypothetical protein FACS1894188_05600 [Clostridia bacterium]|nr:hypothetical protein FACS1894188_05600 [Clostridia bacterium]